MNILVACKIVPDDQDAQVAADGSLDFKKAHLKISEYDMNAIEAAAQLAEANPGSTVKAISVGPKKVDDSKTKKGILARGVDELYMVADDACTDLDSAATAAELAALAGAAGDFDVVIVGAGSADLYAQQVGVHLADALGASYVPAVTEIAADGGKLVCKRTLGQTVETVAVAAPAVLAVLPEIAQPRIAGMKDILAAGKKPMNMMAPQGAAAAVKTVSVKAPEQADRRKQIFGDVAEFAAAVKAAL